MYLWLYDDGPGGWSAGCPSSTAPGCWADRDDILADPATFAGSNPTEMDAGSGTDASGNADDDAIFVADPNPTAPADVVFTWADEETFFGANAPSISAVSFGGTPTVTVTGSNFGSEPTGTPETCNAGDTGDDFPGTELVLSDLSENWGAGGAGDCIGLLATAWSSTQVVFTVGSQYADYGPIDVGDLMEVSVLGATDTVTASFATPSSVTSPAPVRPTSRSIAPPRARGTSTVRPRAPPTVRARTHLYPGTISATGRPRSRSTGPGPPGVTAPGTSTRARRPKSSRGARRGTSRSPGTISAMARPRSRSIGRAPSEAATPSGTSTGRPRSRSEPQATSRCPGTISATARPSSRYSAPRRAPGTSTAARR